MDLSSFYSDIVDDEIKYFQVPEEDLKSSVAAVCTSCCLKSKKKRSRAVAGKARILINKERTFVNCRVPSNRCAYLRTLGTFQTEILGCCFRKSIRESAMIRTNLNKTSVLKLCCVGGASGANALGLLEGLSSSNGNLLRKCQVTILDSCDGWKNSSQRILKKFKEEGKFSTNLSTDAVEVDLSGELTGAALKAVKEADVVCIDRCASELAIEMLIQSIIFHVKKGVLLMLISNRRMNVYGNIYQFFRGNGIKNVLRPLLSEFQIADVQSLQTCRFFVSGWVKMQRLPQVVYLYTNNVCEDYLPEDFSDDDIFFSEDFSLLIGKARKSNDLVFSNIKNRSKANNLGICNVKNRRKAKNLVIGNAKNRRKAKNLVIGNVKNRKNGLPHNRDRCANKISRKARKPNDLVFSNVINRKNANNLDNGFVKNRENGQPDNRDVFVNKISLSHSKKNANSRHHNDVGKNTEFKAYHIFTSYDDCEEDEFISDESFEYSSDEFASDSDDSGHCSDELSTHYDNNCAFVISMRADNRVAPVLKDIGKWECTCTKLQKMSV